MPASSTATTLFPTAPQAGAEAEPLDFAAIYEAHARAIFHLALRLLGDAARAEDAAHDVFLKAFRSLSRFRRQSEVRTWLYRIAINHCRNLRQTWQQRNILLTEDGTFADDAMGNASTPFHIADARELGERIQKALDAIPGEYGLLLLLVADEEMSYEQIAVLTRQSCDCVRGKLYRARKAFATAFQQTA